MSNDEVLATVLRVLDGALSKPLFNPEIYAALMFGCFVVWGWQPDTAYADGEEFHYEMTFVAPAYADKINFTLRV